MKKLILSLLSLLSLNSCAVGSGISAYSLMSIEADRLKTSSERDLIERTKQEIYFECQNRLNLIREREERANELELILNEKIKEIEENQNRVE